MAKHFTAESRDSGTIQSALHQNKGFNDPPVDIFKVNGSKNP